MSGGLTWNADGRVIAGYGAGEPNEDKATILEFAGALKNQDTPTVYWTSDGDKTVSVTLGGNTITGKLNVRRPSPVTLTAVQQMPFLWKDVNGAFVGQINDIYLSLGEYNNKAAPPGIVFTYSGPPAGAAPTRDLFLRQTIVTDFHARTANNGIYEMPKNGETLLDVSLVADEEDSPTHPLSEYFRAYGVPDVWGNYVFQTYLMWRSTKPGAIEVPLKRLEWTMSWDASLVNGVWQWMGAPDAVQNLTSVDWTEPPTWSDNMKNNRQFVYIA